MIGRTLLNSMPIAALGACIVTAAVTVALVGQALVRRFVPVHVREPHNDVAGFIIAVVGVIYAVLLAFVVFVVWDQLNDARLTVANEADAVADLHSDAAVFSARDETRIHAVLLRYAQVVIDDEWPELAEGQESRAAHAAFRRVWTEYRRLQPATTAQTTFYREGIERLNKLADYRRLRLHLSEASVPGVLWAGLALGGMITVGFTYLFGLRNVWAHSVMTALLAAIIALSLFMILALDYPFTGQTAIGPDAFVRVVSEFGPGE